MGKMAKWDKGYILMIEIVRGGGIGEMSNVRGDD